MSVNDCKSRLTTSHQTGAVGKLQRRPHANLVRTPRVRWNFQVTPLGTGNSDGISGVVSDHDGGLSTVLLPLIIAITGTFFSIIGTYFVRIKENGNVQRALNIGNYGALFLTAIASYFIITWMAYLFILGLI